MWMVSKCGSTSSRERAGGILTGLGAMILRGPILLTVPVPVVRRHDREQGNNRLLHANTNAEIVNFLLRYNKNGLICNATDSSVPRCPDGTYCKHFANTMAENGPPACRVCPSTANDVCSCALHCVSPDMRCTEQYSQFECEACG